MGDVVRLDDYRPAPGNGAREALTGVLVQIPYITWCAGVVSLADFMLIALWSAGFMVVPIGPGDDAA